MVHRPGRRLRDTALASIAIPLVGLLVLGSACSDDDTSTSTPTPGVQATTPASSVPSGTGQSSPTGAAASPSAAPSTNAITIDGFELGYRVSGALKPGTATVTFRNTGTIDHMMAAIRVKPGTTADQVKQAVSSGDNSAFNQIAVDDPDTAAYGLPTLLSAGQTETVTTDLQAGTYAILCFVPLASGQPHAAVGMVSTFNVEGTPASASTVKEEGAINLSDSRITLPANFDGKGVFRVVNSGSKTHSLAFAKLESGTTMMKLIQYIDGRFQDNQPPDGGGGVITGGVDTLAPGQAVYVTLNLPAGHYGYASPEGGDTPDRPADATVGLVGGFDVA